MENTKPTATQDEMLEDPPSRDYSSVAVKYETKIDGLLLANLMIDLDWYIVSVSEAFQTENCYNPSMEEILDSLYNTGKYLFMDDRNKIEATLNLKEKSYQIIVSPFYIAYEVFFSEEIGVFLISPLEEKSSSKIEVSDTAKEILITYPNHVDEDSVIN